MMRISVIVPTYQEKDNIVPLVRRIGDALDGQHYEIIVVDDDSPDHTAEVALSLSDRYPIRVIKRQGVRGLGSAILTGFQNATGDAIGVIDADLQHPPEVLAQLAEAVQTGADIAIASRYVAGGGVRGWSLLRRIVSKSATLLARPLTGATDPMSGCFMLTRETFEYLDLRCTGYKVLLEILVKAGNRRVKEVPYTFDCRQFGESKLSPSEYTRYLMLLVKLYLGRLQTQLGRYA